MRIVAYKEFRTLPAGTFFAKGARWSFGTLRVKGQTTDIGFEALDPCWAGETPIHAACEAFDDSLKNSTSFRGTDAFEADESIKEPAVYMVFEREELLALQGHLVEALGSVTPYP